MATFRARAERLPSQTPDRRQTVPAELEGELDASQDGFEQLDVARHFAVLPGRNTLIRSVPSSCCQKPCSAATSCSKAGSERTPRGKARAAVRDVHACAAYIASRSRSRTGRQDTWSCILAAWQLAPDHEAWHSCGPGSYPYGPARTHLGEGSMTSRFVGEGRRAPTATMAEDSDDFFRLHARPRAAPTIACSESGLRRRCRSDPDPSRAGRQSGLERDPAPVRSSRPASAPPVRPRRSRR